MATGALSPADVASPIRSILRDQPNTAVILATARSVDLTRRSVDLGDRELAYDYLVLAAGARTAYFGHREWESKAPGLKSVDDVVEIRRRLFVAFEEAERGGDQRRREKLLTFVIVGGGPTGVELAGAVAEIAHDTLPREFRAIDPSQARVILAEGGDRLLAGLPSKLSRSAERDLERLGVEVRLGTRVTRIEDDAVWLGEERIDTATVLWAAGIEASPLARSLGVELDRAGRIVVEPDLSITGFPEVLVVGDIAATRDAKGAPLPGTAPVAIQGGRAAARNLRRRLAGEPTIPFRYRDRGVMATIGRNRAVAVVAGVPFDGFPAWVAWALVHVVSLVEFRSRVAVSLQWAWTYATRQRTARIITAPPDWAATSHDGRSPEGREARPAIEVPGDGVAASAAWDPIATVSVGRSGASHA